MFERLTDVPEDIRGFYHEVTKSEPLLDENGDQVYELVNAPVVDDFNNKMVSKIKAPVYHDVIYVEKLPRGEFKTLDDVWRIVEIHKGKRDELIRSFLGMVNEARKWRFHDEYLKAILTPTPLIDGEYNPEPLPVLELIDVEQWFYDNYRALRLSAYPSKDEQLEMQYDDVVYSTNKWVDIINNVKLQYPKCKSGDPTHHTPIITKELV